MAVCMIIVGEILGLDSPPAALELWVTSPRDFVGDDVAGIAEDP